MRHRWLALGSLVAATCVLGVFAARVGIDNSVDVWFVEGDPTLATYKQFQDTFGNDEVVAIAVVDSKGVWRAPTLNRLYDLTAAIEGIDGVSRVIGVTRGRLIELREEANEDGIRAEVLDVSPLMGGHVDAAGAATLRARVEADPLLADRLVLGDGKVAVLFAQMEAMGDIDAHRDRILTELDEVLRTGLEGGGVDHHVAGIGVIYNALNRISQTEGGLFMGASFLVIFLLLWPLFRSLLAVGASILSVACAFTMTRGIYGLFGNDDNMVTMTLPVLVLILGVADCIHIFRYRATYPDRPAKEVLAEILQPCIFTTLTTMVGFAALGTSRMAVVRDLGIYAAVGIGLAFLSSTIVCSAAMASPRLRIKQPSAPGAGAMGGFLAWTARFSAANKEAMLGLTGLVVLLCAYGVSLVEVDTYSMGFLSEDHPVRQDSRRIEEVVGPFTPLELVVESRSDEPEAIVDAEVFRAALAFQRAFTKREDVRDAFSLADITARLHQVQSPPGTPLEVPDNTAMVGEHIEFYRGDPDGQAAQLADAEWRQLRITFSVPVLSARQYRELIGDAETLARSTFPDSVEVRATGYLPLYVKMMDYVVESQVSSFGIAFAVVFLLIGVLFRSVRMTALAVLPNVLPVFVTLGVMGFFGINLDVATVTITAIIIGIVVDDTIHYLHRFRAELVKADGDFGAAADATALGCGRAIGATTLIFTVGFLVLGMASVKSIVYFGLLTALAMVVALLGDLLILPAILLTLKPRVSREVGS